MKQKALLISVCRQGNLLGLQKFAERGFDLHFSNDVCLREACAEGHLEVVKYLVDKGAGKVACDIALRTAIMNGHTKIVQYFKNRVLREKLKEI